MESAIRELEEKGRAAKAASRKLAFLATEVKNKALLNIAEALIGKQDEILAANKIDYEETKASGMDEALLDRLMLSSPRLEGMVQDVKTVAALPDPVGEMFDMRTLPNGLQIGKKRVPLGVIGAIYESRPNVTIDISSLCLKSGNAVILRGGKETINSNTALARVAREACDRAGVPDGAIQLIESTERALVNHMLKMKGIIDLIIPRGGASLIKLISDNATMPVITGGIGVCHTYVDRSADLSKAVAIAYNAKVQRPTVCNALDCILVHNQIAQAYLPAIAGEWAKAGVEMHCDERALAILKSTITLPSPSKGEGLGEGIVPATEEDWGKEYLSLNAAVKVVDSLDEALGHIEKYGSGHSEAIVTEDYSAAMRFLNEVDAACVYANASTRFTDGSQFGLGAEIGISTQKFHARGPMALKELASYKWVVLGSGQVRP
jgi:glutamate-5-semialdehyde dehydrogenase